MRCISFAVVVVVVAGPDRGIRTNLVIIILDNFCIALLSGVHKLTALYNTLQHFLS